MRLPAFLSMIALTIALISAPLHAGAATPRTLRVDIQHSGDAKTDSGTVTSCFGWLRRRAYRCECQRDGETQRYEFEHLFAAKNGNSGKRLADRESAE